jgi:hypothetical protein
MSRFEHLDRDRNRYDRDPLPSGGDRRERFESHDHLRRPGSSVRDHSGERPFRHVRAYDDDFYVRDRRTRDDPRHEHRDYDRDVVIEKDRTREVVREVSPAPMRRPTVVRRQSSLDTFDRRPMHFFEREERYGPPARREDVVYRHEPYVPIPLARTRALPPPPRRVDDRHYDEIRIADPTVYGDEEFRPYPERVREREVVRTERRERRARSPDSVTSRTYTRTSRSSSVSSRSSSRSRSTTTTATATATYPRKGKTRMPSRMVSKRALIDLGYPFMEEVRIFACQVKVPAKLTMAGKPRHHSEGAESRKHQRGSASQRRVQEE